MTLWPDSQCCVVKSVSNLQRVLPTPPGPGQPFAPTCCVLSPDAWMRPTSQNVVVNVVVEPGCPGPPSLPAVTDHVVAPPPCPAVADRDGQYKKGLEPATSLEAQLAQAQLEAQRLKHELEQEKERSHKRAERIQELLLATEGASAPTIRSTRIQELPLATEGVLAPTTRSAAKSARSPSKESSASPEGMPRFLDVDAADADGCDTPHRRRTVRCDGTETEDVNLLDMLLGSESALSEEQMLEALNGTFGKDGKKTGAEDINEQFEWMFVIVLPNPRLEEMQYLRPEGITELEAGHVFDTCFKGEDTHRDMLHQAECFDREKELFLRAFRALPDAGDDHCVNDEAEAEGHGQGIQTWERVTRRSNLNNQEPDLIPEAAARINNIVASIRLGLRSSLGSFEPNPACRTSVVAPAIHIRKKRNQNAVAMQRMTSVFGATGHVKKLKKMVLRDSIEKPPKRFVGMEPEDSAWYGQVRRGESFKDGKKSTQYRPSTMSTRDGEFLRAQSFLELLRNQIVTKLTMHAQLATRMSLSEDGESVLLLVTCRPADLLAEAECQSFPTELQLRAVDPKSLEPCCPSSFYPLLDWYLGHSPWAPVPEVAKSYRKVLQKVEQATDVDRRERQREVEFWEGAERHLESHSGSVSTRHQFIREKDHIPGTDKHRRNVLKAFVQYLELKADRGLGADPQELICEVNAGYRKPVLVNWHGALNLGTASPPYKVFRRVQYEGLTGKPWEFCSYEACSRQKGVVVCSPFSGANRVKLVKSIMDRQVNLGQLLAFGYVSSVFPLDTREKVEDVHTGQPSKLHKSWSVPLGESRWAQLQIFVRTMFGRAEVDCVRDYFGERIALYFALLDTMSWGLVLPGAVGGATWAVQQLVPYEPHREEAPLLAVATNLMYSTAIAAWSTWMLQMWKRKQATLAHRWGQTDTRRVEMPRPHFRGHPTRSPVTYDDAELKFSLRKRTVRQAISLCFLIVLCILELFGTYWLGDFRTNWVKNRWRFHRFSQSITGMLYAAQMWVCEMIGLKVAKEFNEWENYKTHEQYLNALILKAVGHELWNRFHAYFWIAFSKASSHGCLVLEDNHVKFLDPEGMNGRMCLYELKVQLQTVMFVEFLKNIKVVFKPVIGSTLRNLRRAAVMRDGYEPAIDDNSGHAKMSHFCQAAIDRLGYGELEVDGTFEDYLDVVTLFGHFTLFSLCFPLAPGIGFTLLVMRLRVDGLKLYALLRRPLPASAEHVGNWYQVMHAMTWASMLANALLTVYTFGSFDDPPGYWRFLGPLPKYVFFVFFAGALTLLKVTVSLLVPEQPENIRIAQLHHEWVRDQIDVVSSVGTGDGKESRCKPKNLHLDIGTAMSGQWRAPLVFGHSILRFTVGKTLSSISAF